MQSARVIAAHIWPKSGADSFPFDAVSEGVNNTCNGIFLLKSIEKAFDKLQVCFVCNPFNITVTFVVLHGGIVNQDIPGTRTESGGMMKFRNLHMKILNFDKDKRPSFRLLSRHAQQAFAHPYNTKWMANDEMCSFQNALQVGSPEK
mmetsp:Transcript_32011/g.78534  ORF Transcript_32011/g.78534 Transcript_32011/m.78534 type:complete len:147 (+) Transcript_32011:272-712(+)